MTGFILRRLLLQMLPVLFVSSVVVFGIVRLIPGDTAAVLAGPDATSEALARIRDQFGLDEPLPVQYLIWLKGVLTGDMGTSYVSGLPVTELIAQRIPATLELAVGGLLVATLVGIPAGVGAAVRAGKPVDWVVSTTSNVLIAVPNFWLGILGILFFAVGLGWLPPGGRVPFLQDPITAVQFLALPVIALCAHALAILTQYTRSSVIDTLHENYIRTARAKGLAPRYIIGQHALRNALVPVVTMMAILFGRMIGGAVVVESVFAWPGIGRLLIGSIGNRDYGVVQGVLLLLVLVFLVINLVVDICYAALDPRIQVTAGGTTR